MSKPSAERRLAENEASAFQRAIRISPRKLNLVAGMIRGKSGPDRACRADLLAPAHRQRRQEGAAGGDRQCREQPSARRRSALCQGSDGRPRLRDEAVPHARPRPLVADRETFRASHGDRARTPRRRPRGERPDGSEGQSDRAAARHQPNLGFALVRRQGLQRPAARGPEAAQVPRRAAEPGGDRPHRDRARGEEDAHHACIRRGRASSSARRAPTSRSCASISRK